MFRQVKLPSPTTNHRHFLCFCTFFVVPSCHLCCDQTILNLTKLYIQILFNYGVIISSEITFGRFLVIRRLQMWLFVKVRWFLNVDFKMILHTLFILLSENLGFTQTRYFYGFHSVPLISYLLTIDCIFFASTLKSKISCLN